ncbi:MAG: hypothetical protein KBG30_13500 [Bacteroidales bacterium]|nr:hypothetical protein [Bacteroidales bacterium]
MTIDEWGICKKVTNNTGKDIFVPTNSSNEWNQFRTYFPSGVSLGTCTTLTVRSIGISGVAITSSSGHGGTTTYSKNVPRGTTVSLTAPTVSGYTFNWSGCVSSTNTTISFSMPANDTNCVANYCNPEFTCGDPVTFTYKGSQVTYGTVAHNCRCWMDRNLGASRVAQSSTDSSAYGDLFQWGRLDDGHQNRTSLTTTTLSSFDNPGHSKFITTFVSPWDWRSPQNNNLWQGVSGINNPCPSGWRIPTINEWKTEYQGWSSNNSAGAYASPLKLTVGGYRSNNGSLDYVGSYGRYQSSTISGTDARILLFSDTSASIGDMTKRAYGLPVRCIRN